MHAQFGQSYVEQQDDKTVTEWMDKQARCCEAHAWAVHALHGAVPPFSGL